MTDAGVELVWIFGVGRSGSTWLARLLGANERTEVWFEPMIGLVFGRVLVGEPFVASPAFVLGGAPEHRLPPVRAFVSAAVAARHPHLGAGDTLVLKEQNASIGAPILSEAFPESRYVLLVRDPRDVLASVKDTLTAPRSWAAEMLASPLPPFDAAGIADGYQVAMGAAIAAFDGHAGPKAIVRYEDLLADTSGTLVRLASAVDWRYDETRALAAAAALAWDAIPEDQKGKGKFFREATPGAWRAELSEAEVEIVEHRDAGVLARFYGGRS